VVSDGCVSKIASKFEIVAPASATECQAVRLLIPLSGVARHRHHKILRRIIEDGIISQVSPTSLINHWITKALD